MDILPGRQLDLLESAGLLSLSAGDPDPEYAFKHSLVQETAYASLVRPRRIELHRQVAEAMESMGPAADAPAAVLALHFKEAGLPGKAFHYAVQAGDLARRTYAHAEALANYDLALSLVPELATEGLGPKLRAIFARRGSILEVTGRHLDAQENYEAMRREAARLNDDGMQADALNHLATVKAVTFSAGDAEALLAEALLLADRARDLPMIARTLWNHGLYHRFHEPDRATDYFRRALAIVERPDCQLLDEAAGIRELEGFILSDLRVTQIVSGQYRAGSEIGRRALKVFRALDNKAMIADSLGGAALVSYYSGRPEEALRFSDEGLAISRAISNPWGLVYNSWLRMDIAFDRGRFDEARDGANELLPLARQVSFPIFAGAIESLLTRLYVAVGLPEVAIAHAEASLQPFTSEASRVSWGIWGLGTIGLALVELGRLDEAAERLEPIFQTKDGIVRGFQGYFVAGSAVLRFALATRQWARGTAFADWLIQRASEEGLLRFQTEVLHWKGRIHAAAGAHGLALEAYEAAAERMRAYGHPALEWENEAHLASALDSLGRQDESSPHRARARDLSQLILAGLAAPDLRRGFARRIAAVLETTPA